MSIIPRPLKLVLGKIIPFSLADKIPTFNLGSGTADSTTYLRGDQSFQTILSDVALIAALDAKEQKEQYNKSFLLGGM